MSEGPIAVEAHGVVKRFGEVRALDAVDLHVAAGEVRGLLGPNGAGKTTLLRVLFGLLRPDAGTVALFGRGWDERGADPLAGVAGFVEEPSFYPYLSGRQNLELLAELDGDDARARVTDVLQTVRLADAADRRVGTFSTGMRQLLGLAASLLRKPRLLLLDEPTLGLDPVGAREMRALLRRLPETGVTVLLSSHDMNEVEGLCDTVTIMRSGSVVWDGTVERLRTEAPAGAYRLSTSDDPRALELAARAPDLTVRRDAGDDLTVSADTDGLDAYVLALASEGIAVRRLQLSRSPLEEMFFSLTGFEDEPSE